MSNNNIAKVIHCENPIDLSDINVKIKHALQEDGVVSISLSDKVRNILKVYYGKDEVSNIIKFKEGVA